MSWAPLFGDLLDSSIWQTPAHVRLAWITILASKHWKTHIAPLNVYRLSVKAKITPEEAEDAYRVLSSADKNSYSQEHEGKRIMPVEGGWLVLTGEKYRQKIKRSLSTERTREAREQKRSLLAHPGEGEKKTKSPPSKKDNNLPATIDQGPPTPPEPPELPRHYPVIDPSSVFKLNEFGDPLAAETPAIAAPSLVSDQAVLCAETPSRTLAHSVKPRNELFDALASVCELKGKLSKALGSEIATALKSMLDQKPDLTVADIERMPAAYQARMPKGSMVTPSALAKWMPSFGSKPKVKQQEDLIV